MIKTWLHTMLIQAVPNNYKRLFISCINTNEPSHSKGLKHSNLFARFVWLLLILFWLYLSVCTENVFTKINDTCIDNHGKHLKHPYEPSKWYGCLELGRYFTHTNMLCTLRYVVQTFLLNVLVMDCITA